MTWQVKGVDVSHYQPRIDFQQLRKDGLLFVILKASEGPGVVDSSFTPHIGPAREAGMLLAAYHFQRPGPVAQQAELFLRVTKADDILPCIDSEVANVSFEASLEFLEYVHRKTGRAGLFYSYYGMIVPRLRAHALPELYKYRLWQAQYARSPLHVPGWPAPFLWQNSAKGRFLGMGYNVDTNCFAGTDEELAGQWLPSAGSPTIVPVMPPAAPPPALLRQGDHGPEVRELQRALGMTILQQDGWFGRQTTARLLAYQQAHHLTHDGIAGPQVFHALNLVMPSA